MRKGKKNKTFGGEEEIIEQDETPSKVIIIVASVSVFIIILGKGRLKFNTRV